MSPQEVHFSIYFSSRAETGPIVLKDPEAGLVILFATIQGGRFMAISGFGRVKGTEDGEISTSPSNPGALTAFIDQGSEFEGKLTFKDTVRIDGRFEGEISSENTLIVGKTGEIQATIHSTNVVVNGTVVGDIHARGQLTLHKTARVDGDVSTPLLVVEEGAIFNGGVSMGKAGSQAKGAVASTPANSPAAPTPVKLADKPADGNRETPGK
jgi:cytoskeletal protein CcmA (bactofilin family)